MDRRGFTLVELLAVIVILSLLALLTSTAVTKLVKDSRQDLYENQVSLILESARTWGADNIYMLPEDGSCKYITLYDLKEAGIVSSSILDPRNNKEISDDMKIYIRSNINSYGKNDITYDIDDSNSDSCTLATLVCEATTSSTASKKKDGTNIGNVPTGNYNVGDEYICNVNGVDKYRFFVLSKDDDNVNLILDRSINSDGSLVTESRADKTVWVSKEDFIEAGGTESDWGTDGNTSKGPITAQKYLKNATDEWTNIPYISVNLTSSTKMSSRSRMPSYDELSSAGCTIMGNCPLWLANYMKYSAVMTGGTNISSVEVYLSSTAISSTTTRNIDYNGTSLTSYKLLEYNVKPVISVPKRRIA